MTPGMVKWYDRKKALGFVVVEGQEKDALLHISVLQASKWADPPPVEGDHVLVTTVVTPKGLRVTSIKRA